jgi:hypothetical protein
VASVPCTKFGASPANVSCSWASWSTSRSGGVGRDQRRFLACPTRVHETLHSVALLEGGHRVSGLETIHKTSFPTSPAPIYGFFFLCSRATAKQINALSYVCRQKLRKCTVSAAKSMCRSHNYWRRCCIVVFVQRLDKTSEPDRGNVYELPINSRSSCGSEHGTLSVPCNSGAAEHGTSRFSARVGVSLHQLGPFAFRG